MHGKEDLILYPFNSWVPWKWSQNVLTKRSNVLGLLQVNQLSPLTQLQRVIQLLFVYNWNWLIKCSKWSDSTELLFWVNWKASTHNIDRKISSRLTDPYFSHWRQSDQSDRNNGWVGEKGTKPVNPGLNRSLRLQRSNQMMVCHCAKNFLHAVFVYFAFKHFRVSPRRWLC